MHSERQTLSTAASGVAVASDELVLVDVEPSIAFLAQRELPGLRALSTSWSPDLADRLRHRPAPVVVSGDSGHLEAVLGWDRLLPVLVVRGADDPPLPPGGAARELYRPVSGLALREAVQSLLRGGAPAGLPGAGGELADYSPRIHLHLDRALRHPAPAGLLRQVARGLLEDLRADLGATAAVLLLDEVGALWEIATVGLKIPAGLWFESTTPSRLLVPPGQVAAVSAADLPAGFPIPRRLHWRTTALDERRRVGGLLLLGFEHPPSREDLARLLGATGHLAAGVRDARLAAWTLQTWSDRGATAPAATPAGAPFTGRSGDSAGPALPRAERAGHTGLASSLAEYAAHVLLLTGREVAVRAEGLVGVGPADGLELFGIARGLAVLALPWAPVSVHAGPRGRSVLLRVTARPEDPPRARRWEARDEEVLRRVRARTVAAGGTLRLRETPPPALDVQVSYPLRSGDRPLVGL